MNVILWDAGHHNHLLPFTYTRPVAEIRVGILTITDKYRQAVQASEVSWLTEPYLQQKYPVHFASMNLLVNGAVLPDKELIHKMTHLDEGAYLYKGSAFIAARLSESEIRQFTSSYTARPRHIVEYDGHILICDRVHQIFRFNEVELNKDYHTIVKNRKSAPIDASNRVINPENIFLEAGAKVLCATINASFGPVYIGKDAEVMEGSLIRGPFSLGDHSTLKLGAKIYGATTVGPHSKIGGEVSNSVIFGYSNKGHDGFLGNSVIGEWCNIGADSNNSNLKNNYEEVKLWNYESKSFEGTGLQFCGLFMGDHSKCGINTMFNTGTMVGVSSNIFGGGFPRNIISSFAWGGASGFTTYKIDKAFDTAEKVMERRHIELTKLDRDIMTYVYNSTKSERS